MRGSIAATGAALAMILSMAACADDNTPVCRPATVASCYCVTGAIGEKICEEDGLDYSTCECATADASATPSMTTEASPDAGVVDTSSSGY